MLPGGGAQAEAWDISRNFPEGFDLADPPFDIAGLSEDDGLSASQTPYHDVKWDRGPFAKEVKTLLVSRVCLRLIVRREEDVG